MGEREVSQPGGRGGCAEEEGPLCVLDLSCARRGVAIHSSAAPSSPYRINTILHMLRQRLSKCA